jgi:hypothetical protein
MLQHPQYNTIDNTIDQYDTPTFIQIHTIVRVRPRRCCSPWLQGRGGGGAVHIIHPRPKNTSDDQCIQETSVGHIRRPEYRLALGTKGHCDSMEY